MIRDFYLLFFSSLLLIFSVFSYYRYDVKSTELEGNIIYNPFQKNEWKERINTFLSYDGSYFSTIIIKDEFGRSHIFSSNGDIEKTKDNTFKITSKNKMLSKNNIKMKGSEAYTNLSKIDGYKIVDSFNIIYKDNRKRILERPNRDIKFILLKDK